MVKTFRESLLYSPLLIFASFGGTSSTQIFSKTKVMNKKIFLVITFESPDQTFQNHKYMKSFSLD